MTAICSNCHQPLITRKQIRLGVCDETCQHAVSQQRRRAFSTPNIANTVIAKPAITRRASTDRRERTE